jgi:hypothetical protein
MGQLWNNTDSENMKYLGIKVSQCHFVCHKSHMDWLYLGSNPDLHYESRNMGHDNNSNKYA